jgi:ABC-type multidrug transport system fused ATPase/permease subunit
VAAAFETVGALVVLALLRRITTEQSGFELPLVGNVRELVPGVDDTTLLVIVGVVVAGFFVARAALLVFQAYLQSRVTENASANLATRLVTGYLAMPYSFLLRRNSAELIRNTFDTVQQYARDALSPAVRLISQSLVAIMLVAVLLATSPWATLLAVAILAPFSWPLRSDLAGDVAAEPADAGRVPLRVARHQNPRAGALLRRAVRT